MVLNPLNISLQRVMGLAKPTLANGRPAKALMEHS